jgi:chromosomal replication initiation ATPase DnaA
MKTAIAEMPHPIERPTSTASRSVRQPRASGLRGERDMEICESMIDICAAMFNVSSKELRQTGRTANGVARVRQIAMYVTHVALGLTMHEVGRGFFRERTTVRHACHLVEDMRDDEDFDRAVVMMERVARAAFRHRIDV